MVRHAIARTYVSACRRAQLARAFATPRLTNSRQFLPDGIFAERRLGLLQLPDGFRYMSYSWTGDPLRDGTLCPNLYDGMAVVDQLGNSGKLILVRNHEGDVSPAPYINAPEITYASDGGGGTTNLRFDTKKGQWEAAWATLAGTVPQFARGVTPWSTWSPAKKQVRRDMAGSSRSANSMRSKLP